MTFQTVLILAGMGVFALLFASMMIWHHRRAGAFRRLRETNARLYPGVFDRKPPTSLDFTDDSMVNIFDVRYCRLIGKTKFRNVRKLIEIYREQESRPLPHNGFNDLAIVDYNLEWLQTEFNHSMDATFLCMLAESMDSGFVTIRWVPVKIDEAISQV